MKAVTMTVIPLAVDRLLWIVRDGEPTEVRVVASRTILFENGNTRDDFLTVDPRGYPEWLGQDVIFSDKKELARLVS